jgi:hypothetical protein
MAAVLRIGPGTQISSLGTPRFGDQALPSSHAYEAAKVVARKLILDLPPEQISGPLRIQYRIRVAPHVASRLSPINPH